MHRYSDTIILRAGAVVIINVGLTPGLPQLVICVSLVLMEFFKKYFSSLGVQL